MSIDERFTRAPLLEIDQLGFSSHYNSNLGNSATMAELDLLRSQYGASIDGIVPDLQGRGYTRGVYNFPDGSRSFNPDLQYTTRSWLDGSTSHFDEVKARAVLGGWDAGQLDNYARAISERNLANSDFRFAGSSLRYLGMAGTALDGYFTYGEISERWAVGDLDGAGLTAAEFGGRWAGGLALGTQGAAWLGGWGSALGPWGTLAGGVVGGIGGGVIGAFGGEAIVDWAGGLLGFEKNDLSLFNGPLNLAYDAFDVSPSGVPGISLLNGDSYDEFPIWGSDGSDVLLGGSYGDSFFGSFGSASQIAGIGLSLTSDIGSGGFASAATYAFTPGQTSNSIFDDSWLTDYSPTYNYSGNGYADYDWSSFDYSGPDYSGSDYSSSDYSGYHYSSDDWGSASFDDFSYDYDFGFPVVLDLAGNGLNITPQSSSNVFYDMAGDGYKHRTAWAGTGNGVLVLDLAGTGQITERNQVIFTDWDPTATSDMQALANVFDTNQNGKLDAGDAQFSAFKILVTNADGTTSLQSLAAA